MMQHQADLRTRILAALAYLVPLVGPLAALLLGRHRMIQLHARQSLLLTLLVACALLVWGVLAWILNWIPVIGAITGAMLFAFVPLLWLGAVLAHVGGTVLALRGQYAFVPVFRGWMAQWISPESWS